MGSTKLTIKQSPRARGTVSLAKIRRAIDAVLAERDAAQESLSPTRAKKSRKQARAHAR